MKPSIKMPPLSSPSPSPSPSKSPPPRTSEASGKPEVDVPEDEVKKNWEEHGKEAINHFLWLWLPDSMTLGACEELAVDIHALIQMEWDRREATEATDVTQGEMKK